ncbi:N-acetyltransferase [Curtobacterium sp. MCBD17_032]|uniref:GNAT family N-acetyltransferase n=1 Tax=Curtobacterium sp. MCBD17_032 TaxID=2175659 RepID=UPI0011B4941F|nr:hypothetical protein [Curtobacterium sp. MCBD17_032]
MAVVDLQIAIMLATALPVALTVLLLGLVAVLLRRGRGWALAPSWTATAVGAFGLIPALLATLAGLAGGVSNGFILSSDERQPTVPMADPRTVAAEQLCQQRGQLVAQPVERGSPAELLSLYVDPDRFGSSIGSALHNRFVGVVPPGTAELEVWDGNDRAESFYSHRGWRPTTRSRPGVAGKPFVIWTLDLRPSARPNTVR